MFTFFLSSQHSAEVTQYLNRVTITDTTVRSAIITLIDSLVSQGLWDKIDLISVIQDSSAASITNLKPVGNVGTLVGSPTFTAKKGIACVGGTSYINTNFNPSTAGNVVSAASSHVSTYLRSISGSTDSIFGALDTSVSPQAVIQVNDSGSGSPGIRLRAQSALGISLTTPGFIGGTYGIASATLTDILTNSTWTAGSLTGSRNIPNLSMFAGDINTNGAATNAAGQNVTIAGWTAGQGLSQADLTTLGTTINTYMIAIGANV